MRVCSLFFGHQKKDEKSEHFEGNGRDDFLPTNIIICSSFLLPVSYVRLTR